RGGGEGRGGGVGRGGGGERGEVGEPLYTGDDLDAGEGVEVPGAQRVVAGAEGDEAAAVGGEGHRRDRALVPAQARPFGAGLVPDVHAALVGAAGDPPPVRRGRHAPAFRP